MRADAPDPARGAGSAPSEDAEFALAFAAPRDGSAPRIEVCVNFGLHSGREASPAEIDRFARTLLQRVERLTIVSETRREIDAHSQAAVHQVRIIVAADDPAASEELERWLVDSAEAWARVCVADRPTEGILIEEP